MAGEVVAMAAIAAFQLGVVGPGVEATGVEATGVGVVEEVAVARGRTKREKEVKMAKMATIEVPGGIIIRLRSSFYFIK